MTQKDKREQWQSLLTTAGLAALPFAGCVLHGSSCWGGRWWCFSRWNRPRTDRPLSTAGSDLAASQIALGGILALRLLEVLGRLARVVSERPAGFEAPSLLAVLPRS